MKKFILIALVGCSLGMLMQAVLSDEPLETAANSLDEEQEDYFGTKQETFDFYDEGFEDDLNDDNAPEDGKVDDEDEREVDDAKPDEDAAASPLDEEESDYFVTKEKAINSIDEGFEDDLNDNAPDDGNVEDEGEREVDDENPDEDDAAGEKKGEVDAPDSVNSEVKRDPAPRPRGFWWWRRRSKPTS